LKVIRDKRRYCLGTLPCTWTFWESRPLGEACLLNHRIMVPQRFKDYSGIVQGLEHRIV
jgi:hypothetical protein